MLLVTHGAYGRQALSIRLFVDRNTVRPTQTSTVFFRQTDDSVVDSIVTRVFQVTAQTHDGTQ